MSSLAEFYIYVIYLLGHSVFYTLLDQCLGSFLIVSILFDFNIDTFICKKPKNYFQRLRVALAMLQVRTTQIRVQEAKSPLGKKCA